MKIRKVTVEFPHQSYDALIGAGAVKALGKFVKKNFSSAFVIYDQELPKPYLEVKKQLQLEGIRFAEYGMVAGESVKTLSVAERVFESIFQSGMNRSGVIIAVGGGTIGDLGGFIASIYMRGVSWIGVPTTLLAQVDSCLGGKTGVNLSTGKNIIGAFHQPRQIICDTNFLETLSKRDFNSGLGEILKYALVYDPRFFRFIETNWKKLTSGSKDVLGMVVMTSLKWKTKAIVNDVFDKRGVREVLNFGHTFGHALETETQFSYFRHGEAIIWGMRFAGILSEIRGSLKIKENEKIQWFLSRIPLPILPTNLDFEKILAHMRKDKKIVASKYRFVLLKGLGKTLVDEKIEDDQLREAFRRLKVAPQETIK